MKKKLMLLIYALLSIACLWVNISAMDMDIPCVSRNDDAVSAHLLSLPTELICYIVATIIDDHITAQTRNFSALSHDIAHFKQTSQHICTLIDQCLTGDAITALVRVYNDNPNILPISEHTLDCMLLDKEEYTAKLGTYLTKWEIDQLDQLRYAISDTAKLCDIQPDPRGIRHMSYDLSWYLINELNTIYTYEDKITTLGKMLLLGDVLNFPELVDYIIRIGSNVNIVSEQISKYSNFSFPLIMSARKNRRTKSTILLLAAGANPHKTDRCKNTALIKAAAGNCLTTCKVLVDKYQVDVNHKNLFKNTALIKSATLRDYRVMQFLLEKGAALTCNLEDTHAYELCNKEGKSIIIQYHGKQGRCAIL